MEDILIIDNNSIEETVIDETEYKDYQPIDSDFSLDKSINKNELIEEESIEYESKQVNQPDNTFYYRNVVNYNNSNENINIKNYEFFNLWLNPNPSSQFVGGSYVTLSDVISNYDLIAVEYKRTINDVDTTLLIVKSNDFINLFNINNQSNNNTLGLGFRVNNDWYYRPIMYYDTNTVLFGGANGWPRGDTNESYCIPIRIYGLIAESLSNNELPVVSGNNIYNYNYNIYCDEVSDNSLSYNILNKPLNDYTVSESLIGMSVLFMLAFGFILLMRKAVFRWR